MNVDRRWILAGALAALSLACARMGLRADAEREPTSEAVGDASEETVYAAAITAVADSAMHRLDFFPARSQLGAQLFFVASPDSTTAVFDVITRRSANAAMVLDEMLERFATIRVPGDLHGLHAELVASLRDARGAADRLASSATACRADASSVTRCQTPFTAASSAVARAYRHYLDTRVRIRDRVRDTQTVLPDFKRPG